MRVPWGIAVAVRLLPEGTRDEVTRELLEQHAAVRSDRGRLAAWWWSWQQPLATMPFRESRGGGSMWYGLGSDFTISQRALRARPGLSLTVIATIALSVAATASIASVVDAVLLRPLPFPDPQQLVWVTSYERAPGAPAFESQSAARHYANPMDVVDWAARERHMDAMMPFQTFEATAQADDVPIRVDAASVGVAMDRVLRIQPALGRLFVDEDADPGVRVAVLSNRLWRTAYAADPALIGRRLVLNGESFEVIGILPPMPLTLPVPETDVWLPLPRLPATFQNRGGVWQRVIGRVESGVPIETAEADLERIARELAAEHPGTNARRHVRLVPLRDGLVGSTRAVIVLIAAAMGLVLLIAGANVGHLLLVGAQARSRELAVRAALGARPWRLARLLMVESLCLAAVGGAAGLVIAPWLLRAFLLIYPRALPAVGDVSLQPASFAAALAATVLAALLAVLPSWLNAHGRQPQSALRTSERGSETRGLRRIRAGLVVTQVALSTALLIGGGALLRTFLAVRATDTGLAPGNVLTFNLALGEGTYPTLAHEVRFYDRLLAEVRQWPGVQHAGASTLLPLAPGEFLDGFFRVGFDDVYPKLPVARLQNVTPGYLEAIGLPLRQGRTLRQSDTAAAPRVLVVNETFERSHLPAGAVGRHIRFRGEPAEIVGVVGDKKHRSVRETPRADMFFVRAQIAEPRLLGWVAIRTSGDALALTGPVRDAIRRLDPMVAIDDVMTMSRRTDTALAPDRFRALLVGSLAAMALALAIIGLYGLIAYNVARDARDIAIRMALGAKVGQTVGPVLRGVLLLTGAGMGTGVGLALAGREFVSGFVAGVAAFDPLTVGLVLVGLPAIAMVAAARPAMRASRIDPAAALRSP